MAALTPPPPTSTSPSWPPPTSPSWPPPSLSRRSGNRLRWSRWSRWSRWAVAAALAGSVALDPGALGVVAFLFVVVVPFEKLFPRHPQRLRRAGLGTDIAYGLAQPLLVPAGFVVGIVVGGLSLAWVPGLALRPLVGLLPPLAHVVIGVLLFDVVTYWVHRLSHEVPFLWRFHAVHHSTEQLDWVSGLRAHPFDGALLAAPFLFLLAAGFTTELAGGLAVLQAVLGLFLHANVRWRWGVLHRVVITPEFHHWHHADEPAAHHSNYSVFLPLWDIVFRTYYMPSGRRPAVYGVSPPLPTGIVAQLRHPFAGLPRPRLVVRHPLVTARLTVAAARRGVGQIASTVRSRARA